MSNEMSIVLTTLGTVAVTVLGVVITKLLFDVAKAARDFARLCARAEDLLPQIEVTVERLGEAAGEAQAVGREARTEIDELREGGRRVAALVSGAKAGWDALQN